MKPINSLNALLGIVLVLRDLADVKAHENDMQESVSNQPYQGDTVDEDKKAWDKFEKQYNRNYESAKQEQTRFDQFKKRLREIEEHNELYRKGFSSYRMGVNQFTDWTEEELKALTPLLPMRRAPVWGRSLVEMHRPQNICLPDQIDWRDKGYVTPVKDQGGCGSCWAFSTTGTLEGQWRKKTGKLVNLSEQQLVDCSGGYKNIGCEGGKPRYTLMYLHDMGGNQLESDYPYTGKNEKCKFKEFKAVAKVQGYKLIQSENEDALMDAVATIGPVSAVIYATSDFDFYKDGIFDDPICSSRETADLHAVLVVGYGSSDGKDYWIVKNSYGRRWGDRGYIRMSRNKENQCGIATEAVYPIV